MNITTLAILAITLGLLIYLVIALLYPENF